jgi:hypothetical protein
MIFFTVEQPRLASPPRRRLGETLAWPPTNPSPSLLHPRCRQRGGRRDTAQTPGTAVARPSFPGGSSAFTRGARSTSRADAAVPGFVAAAVRRLRVGLRRLRHGALGRRVRFSSWRPGRRRRSGLPDPAPSRLGRGAALSVRKVVPTLTSKKR